MNRHFRLHLIFTALYTLLALWLTWPLAAHFTTHIPGEATWAFDESTFVWNMWWLKFSLLNLAQTPLLSTYTFFPLGINLTTYTFNLFNAAISLPLQLAFSLPVANNLTLLFSYISSAYGMFLLSLYLLSRHPSDSSEPRLLAAFIAGAVYAFSASRMMYVALGHYNFVTIQWFPFYTLFLLKMLHGGSFKTIVLTALFAAFCIYAELTYSVFLIFITLLVFLGEWLTRRKTAPKFVFSRNLYLLGLVVLFTLVFTAPFILAVLPDFLNPAYAEPGWGEGLKLSADLAGLFTVTPLHPLSGLDWTTELRAVIEGTSRFNDANTLFLGYGILALAVLGFVVRRKEGAMWLWGVIIFTILSLGPLLTINGQNRFDLDGIEATFPLPFALLHYIPIINAHRVPNRFGIPLTLCMAVLVGFAVDWLLVKIASQRVNKSATQSDSSPAHHPSVYMWPILTIVLLAILLFDQYSIPLPLTDAGIPEVYEQIGNEPDDFTLLQLPLGWRNSYGTLGAERTQLQYYQSAHQRPMLGGNTSRNPAFKFDYYANIPLFNAITETELYHSIDETTLKKAKAQAAKLMTLFNIKYLVIHDPLPQRKPYVDTYLATRKLALDLIPHQPEPTYQSPGVTAYTVEQAPIPNPFIIDFGDWTGDPYRGEGWAGNEEIYAATANWATDTEAMIFFPVRGEGDRHLSIQIAPFSYPGMPEQNLDLSLNGQMLADNFVLAEGWQSIETTLPEVYLENGLNRLTLKLAHTAQPREVLPPNRAIGNTGVETPVDLEVNSGNDFAFITVGFGADALDASSHRRGVNIAVVHPQSGEVVEMKDFDTAANKFETTALAQFIAGIPAGHIVIIATQGPEATAFFDTETLAAMAAVGLNTNNLTPPFSAIGIKGAAPGAALQVNGSAETSAYLRLGAIPDTRNLAVAVDQVIISQP